MRKIVFSLFLFIKIVFSLFLFITVIVTALFLTFPEKRELIKYLSPIHEVSAKTSNFIFFDEENIVLRVPYVHQYEDLPEEYKPVIMKSACGPSALTMLFKYDGIDTDLVEVIDQLPTNVYVKGVQFYNLPKGADLYEFDTEFIGSDATIIYNTLKNEQPIILNIQNYNGIIGHAVVVVGIMGYDGESADYLIIHDPYVGPYRKFIFESPRTLVQPEGYTNYIGTVKPFILIK